MNKWILSDKRKTINLNNNNDLKPLIYMDSTYEKINKKVNDKIILYPHQTNIVKSMIELEKNRQIDAIHENYVIKCSSSAGVLSEPVGSGKTIELLSLIILQKYPSIFNDYMDTNNFNNNKKIFYNYTNLIKRKFKNILKPTIIFVGSSVLKQWQESINFFTDLKVFNVNYVRDVEILIKKMDDKTINKYDIVLVKNGKITRTVKLPDYLNLENKNKFSTIYIYNIIANMRNYCWARIIIDDFDVIKLPYNAGIINGIFTWYVSSTVKKFPKRHFNSNNFRTTKDLLLYSDYGCSNIMNNTILFNNYNIRNDDEYIKNSNNIYKSENFVYIFKNKNEQYINLLKALGGDANNIAEMINGDAIKKASEIVGVKTNKVSEIFQKILGKYYNKYLKSKKILQFIQKIENNKDYKKEKNNYNNYYEEEKKYTKTDLINLKPITYYNNDIKNIINNVKNEQIKIYNETKKALERVKNNIKEGYCPVCLENYSESDDDYIILKCCGIIICSVCISESVKFSYNRTFVGSCPNCRSNVNMNGIIYIPNDFNLENIISENIEEEKNNYNIEKNKKNEKNKASYVIDIIKNKKINDCKKINIEFDNLMKGKLYKKNNNPIKKILLFSNYDESFSDIIIKLKKNKIKYWNLDGTYNQIHTKLNKFKNYNNTSVLIINSNKVCAGLNIEFATDVIFLHMTNINIIEQSQGRALRFGRTCSLKVHYMCYENEYEILKKYEKIID